MSVFDEIEQRSGALYCRLCGKKMSNSPRLHIGNWRRHVLNDRRKMRLRLKRRKESGK